MIAIARRWLQTRTFRACAVLLTCCVATVGSLGQRISLPGAQCPTAQVQSISVPVKNCCGKIVRYERRAPKPGDAAFVQCRCSANGVAAAAQTQVKYEIGIPVSDVELYLQPLPLGRESYSYQDAFAANPPIPPTPPPS